MAINLNVDPAKLGNTLGAVGGAFSGASTALQAQQAKTAATSGLSGLVSSLDVGSAAVGAALGVGGALLLRRSLLAGGVLGAALGAVVGPQLSGMAP